jgi:hypothetical protein
MFKNLYFRKSPSNDSEFNAHLLTWSGGVSYYVIPIDSNIELLQKCTLAAALENTKRRFSDVAVFQPFSSRWQSSSVLVCVRGVLSTFTYVRLIEEICF